MLSGFLSYRQVGISISPALAWDKTKVIGIGLGSAAGTNFGASVGVTYKAGITDQIAIQPDLSFGMVFVEGSSSKALGLGATLNYYLGDNLEGFYIAAGPGIGYSLEGNYEGVNELGVSIVTGAGYDTGNMQIGAYFGLGLTNAIEGGGDIASVKGRSAGIQVAVFF